ncbi:MAG: hypothetical protein ACE5OW_04315 [Candidatus Bathyarchaeia archaeon]
MKKALKTAKFKEMKNKIFEVIRVTERLCELCDGVIDTRERVLRTVQISDRKDYENLLTRSKVYDRAEVDLENTKIYFCDHDYPGDVHPSCAEKL